MVQLNLLYRCLQKYLMFHLKLKGFTVFKQLKDEELTSKDFVKTITELSVTVKPFIDFLNNAIE